MASVPLGQTLMLTAVALDAAGNAIPNTPQGWTTLDASRLLVPDLRSGLVQAQLIRGPAQVMVELVTGQADTATVDVVAVPTGIAIVSGDGQIGQDGQVLAQPLIVQVTAADGLGVQGIPVAFAVVAGGGSISVDTVLTDASGQAQVTFTLGPGPGTQQVTATTSVGTVTFNASFASAGGGAAFIDIVAGDNQIVPVGTAVPIAPVILVTDSGGSPVPGVPVTFRVLSGGGSVTGGTPLTLADGTATVGGWTLGTAPGSNFLEALVMRGALSAPRKEGDSTVVATGGTPPDTIIITFSATGVVLPPSQLAFVGQPSTTVAGDTISPAVTVAIQDSTGGTVLTAIDAVTIAIADNPALGTLSGTTSAGAVAGIATFNDLSIDNVGTGYTLEATATGLSADTSATFDILTASIPTKVWTGATSTDWSTAGNWVPTGVPTSSDDVSIPAGTPGDPVLSANVSTNDLTVSAGASTETLTDGLIEFQGTFFTQSNSTSDESFLSTGTAVVFSGSSAQNVDFATPGLGGSSFFDVDVDNVGGLQLVSDVQVDGDFTVLQSVPIFEGPSQTLTVLGDVATTASSSMGITGLSVGGTLSIGGFYGVTNTTFTGGQSQVIPASLPYDNVDVLGQATFGPGAPTIFTDLVVSGGGSFPLQETTTVDGNATFSGAGTDLVLNGQTLDVQFGFTVDTDALITMTDPSDFLIVGSTATFDGASTNGVLEQGLIQVGASFNQVASTSPASFASTGTAVLLGGSGGGQIVSFQTPGANLSRFQDSSWTIPTERASCP